MDGRETVLHTRTLSTRRIDFWIVAGLGLLVTLLNVSKPLTVDDTIYHQFATHIAEHPDDPYGFVLGGNRANDILAPPVFLYWWALGIRLFGQEPFLWKLWLLPIVMLLVFCLHTLARRYARGMELPFVCFITCSGAILPCVNLMLDIPALALGLLTILMFQHAARTDSLLWTVATGVLAGVAMQTKYTAAVSLGVVLLHGLQVGQWRKALLVGALAGSMFVGWELLIHYWYGESHFVSGLGQHPPSGRRKFNLIQPLIGCVGSTMAAGIPLILTALRFSARIVLSAAALVVGGFMIVAVVPCGELSLFGAERSLSDLVGNIVFGAFGVALILDVAAVGVRSLSRPRDANDQPTNPWLSFDAFLVGWLVLEVAGYFALSPYPAVRRIIGLTVPGALLAFRLAAHACSERGALIWTSVALSALVGLTSLAVDSAHNAAEACAARKLVARFRHDSPSATVWLVEHRQFAFYGERLGMKRMHTPYENLLPGDWIVTSAHYVRGQPRSPFLARAVFIGTQEWNSVIPMKSDYQIGCASMTGDVEPFRVAVFRVP